MTLARGTPIAGQIVNPMAEKSAKKKPKKSAKADPGVLGTLRTTRPERIGGDRRALASTRTRATATATKPKPAAAKPAPKKPIAKKPAATKQVVKPTAKKPKATPPAGWQAPEDENGRRDGGPTELVTTAVQAAGELAQIGLTVGGQILRRAANRIPGR
jgi:hypothetical protein